jgi:hypothetical protein
MVIYQTAMVVIGYTAIESHAGTTALSAKRENDALLPIDGAPGNTLFFRPPRDASGIFCSLGQVLIKFRVLIFQNSGEWIVDGFYLR